MTANITGRTKVLGIIGSPIEHSLSPVMQNAALAALGLDYVYVPFHVHPQGLSSAVRGLRELGVVGFNVTIPHKSTILDLLDELSPEAEASGAANTVKREGERLIGFNTDGSGLLASLQEDLRFSAAGRDILVVGAGGAACGAIAALCAAGATTVTILNRTADRGEALVERFGRRFPRTRITFLSLLDPDLSTVLRNTDLLLNTTSVGMGGTSFAALDVGTMKQEALVYDMVYAPEVTPLLASAASHGLLCANGLGMLAAQGEKAFELWTGMAPPAGLMRGRLLAALARK